MATKKTRVGAYIPEDLKNQAEKIARSQKRSLSNLIEVLLERAVDESVADR